MKIWLMGFLLLSAGSSYAEFGAVVIVDNVTNDNIYLTDYENTCLLESDPITKVEIAANSATRIPIAVSYSDSCKGKATTGKLLVYSPQQPSGQAIIDYSLKRHVNQARASLASNSLAYHISANNSSSPNDSQLIIRVTPPDVSSNGFSYRNWMEHLSSNPNFANLSLAKTVFPGSHDSFSYALNTWAICTSDPDAAHVLQLTQNRGINWAQAQPQDNFFNNDFRQQLIHGIRYFDVRLCYQNGINYNSHSYLSKASFEENLLPLADFLRQNDKEIVILDLNHVYGYDLFSLASLLDYIYSTYSSWLIPYAQDVTPRTSLQRIWEMKRNLIVILPPLQNQFNFDSLRQEPQYSWAWPSTSISSPWPNTTDYTTIMHYATNQLAHHDENQFLVSQLQQTPAGNYILAHPLSSLFVLNYDSLYLAYGWLQDNRKQLNIYTRDYANGIEGVNLAVDEYGTVSRD